MAEIPKFTGNPVYNQPIGVVTPMRDTSGETLSNIGKKLFEYDYAKKYAVEEQKGKSFAQYASFGQDEAGNVTPIEIPEDFSKVARQNAVPEAEKRFLERLTVDAQSRANVLHATYGEKAGYNHSEFVVQWKAYSEETIKRLASDPDTAKYQSVLAQAMDAEGFTHGSKLYADRLGLEHKAAFVNRVQILESAISNQRAMVGLQSKSYESGDVVGDDADYNKDNILEIIDGLVKDFPTLAEREMMQKLKDDVKQNHFLGKLDNVASALIQNIGDNYNPYMQDVPIGNIMQVCADRYSYRQYG
jgi:Lhr-like helicase